MFPFLVASVPDITPCCLEMKNWGVME